MQKGMKIVIICLEFSQLDSPVTVYITVCISEEKENEKMYK